MLDAHPAPEIPMRDAATKEIPRTAALLARRAAEHGWNVRVTYARGTGIDGYGRPTHVIDNVAVRLGRAHLRAVGIWHDGKFDCGLARIPGLGVRRVKARQLTALAVSS